MTLFYFLWFSFVDHTCWLYSTVTVREFYQIVFMHRVVVCPQLCRIRKPPGSFCVVPTASCVTVTSAFPPPLTSQKTWFLTCLCLAWRPAKSLHLAHRDVLVQKCVQHVQSHSPGSPYRSLNRQIKFTCFFSYGGWGGGGGCTCC